MTGPQRKHSPDWQDRIVKDPQILAGKPTVKGTRISVELIMQLLAGGWSDADIIDCYDWVSSEDIEACIRYAATGAKLSSTSWSEINMRDAILDDELKEKRRLERMGNAGKLNWSVDYTDWISVNQKILGGKPTVRGMRISVELIIDRLEGGESQADLIRNYPSITPEDILACQQYASTGAKLSNTTEVEFELMMSEWETEEPPWVEVALELMERRGIGLVDHDARANSQYSP